MQIRYNKYRRWYNAIMDRAIGRALNGYCEQHHIVPKAFGGSKKKANLVQLTYREHFLAHWLLTKFTVGKERRKMWNALAAMRRRGNGQERILAGWQYALAKKAIHRALIGGKMSDEHKRKTSLSLLGNQRAKGNNKPKSDAHRGKLAVHLRKLAAEGRNAVGKTIARNKQFNYIRGKKRGKEENEKRRLSMLAYRAAQRVVSPDGKALSLETRAKISAKMLSKSSISNMEIN
jgi:hypothetical protein